MYFFCWFVNCWFAIPGLFGFIVMKNSINSYMVHVVMHVGHVLHKLLMYVYI